MKTILLVDDSTFTRNSLKKTLLNLGYDVLEAKNGQDALTIIQGKIPNLIISDLNMPEMDGINLLTELHKNKNQIPILVLTADIQDTTREQCLSLGAKDVISKQFNQSLISKIENICNEAK